MRRPGRAPRQPRRRGRGRRRRSPPPPPTSRASTPSGWGRARSEYTATVVLWRLFWLQSTNTFPGRTAFDIVVTTRFGCCCSSSWPTARANGGGVLVRERSVHGHVQLEALGARRLGPRLEPERGRARRGSTSASSTARRGCRPARPGRGRTPPRAAPRGRRRAPSARAAPAPPCWPPTPAPRARRARSTRCRPCDRRARAPPAPRVDGGSGTASRRSCSPSTPSGNRRKVSARPARCGSIAGATSA